MQTFKDNQGRPWVIHIDVNSIRQVQKLVGVDLFKVTEGKLLHELSEDLCMLVDVLFALVRDQAQTKGLTDLDFGAAMTGDALDAGLAALLEDLVSFFRSGERKMLATLMAKLNRLYKARTDLAVTRMESIDLEKVISEAQNDAGAPSTNSPRSPASIPDR